MGSAINSQRVAVDLQLARGFVVTMDDGGPTFWPGSVAIARGEIVAVGASSDIEAVYASVESIPCDEMVILPGLVDSHVHGALSVLRGIGDGLPLPAFHERVAQPVRQAMDPDLCYHSTRLSCLEMIKAGITSFADIGSPQPRSMARAVQESGLRAVLAVGPSDLEELATTDQLAGPRDGRLSVAMALECPYDVTARKVGRLAAARGLSLHVDLTAGPPGSSLTPRDLDRLGVVRPNSVLAHPEILSAEDIALIVERGASVAATPTASAKHGTGIIPLSDMVARGMTLGLGTDGAATSGRHDLFDEMRLALLLERRLGRREALEATDALRWATRDGARAIGLGAVTGSLQPGKRADVIVVDMRDARFTPRNWKNTDQIFAHLVFSASGADVSTVIVDGRVLMRDRAPLSVDEAAVHAAGQAAVTRLLHEAGLVGDWIARE